MRPLITEKDLKTLESFIKLQFNKKSLKSQLDKFNPLKKTEVTLNWDGKTFKSKHLGFDFERIMDDNEVAALLVTITDVTETVALEQEIKRAGEDQERKTALILEIIQSDSSELELFLSKTNKTLNSINQSLQDYEEITHSILKDFASTPNLAKQKTREETQSEKLANEIAIFASQLAGKNNKKVFTRCSFQMDNASKEGIAEMKDIMIQLARNTVIHGIETPRKRASLGKLEEGNFTAVCELDNTSDNIIGKPAYKFTFRDDGAGLDIEELRERAIALKIKTPAEAKALSDPQVASLIFEPAFSIKEEADEDAGRGMGMDIIRDRIINTLGGKLSMNFAPGYYMKFTCFIPVEALESNFLNTQIA